MNALTYKCLIEFLDAQLVKTYFFDNGNFDVLRLHGGETYKLNGKNVAEYWRQFNQETGCTTEDSTDICVIWREGLDGEKIFSIVKNSNGQNLSTTTWTGTEVEKFFAATSRQLKSELKRAIKGTIRVKTVDGQNFLIRTCDNPSSSAPKISQQISQQTYPQNPPEQEKIVPPSKKIPNSPATSKEIAEAWAILSKDHTTTKKGGTGN